SKMFTAAALLRLEQDGKLTISDPMSKFFEGAPEKAGMITIRQLLSNTSGLSDRAEIKGPLDLTKRDEVAKAILESKLAHDPGVELEWCNRGFNLAAIIVEKTAGI